MKFSVRSDTYSGGALIDVPWFDGLTEAAAEALVRQFEGAKFDETIDLKAPAALSDRGQA